MGNEDAQIARDMIGINLVLSILDQLPEQMKEVSDILDKLEFNLDMLSRPIQKEEVSKKIKDKQNAIKKITDIAYTTEKGQLPLLQMLLARTAVNDALSPFEDHLNCLIEEIDDDYPHDGLIRLHVTRLKKAVNTAVHVFFGLKNQMLDQSTLNARSKIIPMRDDHIYSKFKVDQMRKEKKSGKESDAL